MNNVPISEATTSRKNERAFSKLDLLLVIVFAALSFLYYYGRSMGYSPVIQFSGDAQNILAFTAGQAEPHLFDGDEVLGNLENFRVYSIIQIQIIQVLSQFTGDYGSAFILLLPLQLFLQMCGFYLLGRVLFKNRFWALILSLITLVRVPFGVEYWGIHPDPQPRFAFQALLPFLLTGAVLWRSAPNMWPLLMIGAGALIYIHPVSAPVIGFAIWLGLWSFRSDSWTFVRQSVTMLSLGLLFLLTTLPFMINYLSNFEHGSFTQVDHETLYSMLKGIFDKRVYDIPLAAADLMTRWNIEYIYWGLAILGSVFLVRQSTRHKEIISTVWLWIAGILITSFLLPYIDQTIARMNESLPYQVDLIRGTRYLIPIFLMLSLWPLAEITKLLVPRPHPIKYAVQSIGAALLGIWVLLYPMQELIAPVRCWASLNVSCVPQAWKDRVAALEAIRELTLENSTILSTSYQLPIRYYAKRPLLFTDKDSGILAYSNIDAFLEWHERKERFNHIDQQEDPAIKLNLMVDFANELGASYLLIDAPYDQGLEANPDLNVLWSNEDVYLIEL